MTPPAMTVFPVPAGGMSLDGVPEMLAVYGRELIFLIGGGLHRHGPDQVESCRHFRRLVERVHPSRRVREALDPPGLQLDPPVRPSG